MFEFPAGLPQAILFAGSFVLLLFRGTRPFSTKHHFWVFLSLGLALLAQIVLVSLPELGTVTGGILSGRPSGFFGLAVLLFAFFSQILFFFEGQKLKSEAAPLQLFYFQLIYTVATSGNLIVIGVCTTLAALSQWFAPLVSDRVKAERRDPSIALLCSTLLFFFFSVATSLWNSTEGTVSLDDLMMRTLSPESTVTYGFAWGALGIAIFGVLLLAILPGHARDFERAGSWSIVGQFRQSQVLMAGILLVKWMRLGSISGFWPDGQTRVGLGIFLLVASLVLAQTRVLRKTQNRLLIWTLLPVTFLAASDFAPGIDWQARAAGMFPLYSLAGLAITMIIVAIDVPLEGSLEDLWSKLRKAPIALRGAFFFAVMACIPIGSLAGFQVMGSLLEKSIWNSEAVLVLISVGVICLAEGYTITSLLLSGAEQNEPLIGNKKSLVAWIYFVLIPLIFLGILPSPLYNYFRVSLEGLFVGR